ncbi:MAG: hypothetical protein J6X02_00865 [Bacilli bacterium]|nr:hypothetical protein [Bacilli bacterium]
MIIGNSQKGTVRENINNLKGERHKDTYSPLGERYKKDDPFQSIKSQVDMSKIDPDDRGEEYNDESSWKDFY